MTAAAPDIAVVGSINLDIVVRTARLPRPGETVHGDSVTLTLGGKGANQAVAARRLGANVLFVGRTGTDGFGGIVRDHLTRYAVSLADIGTSATASTGMATIGIDSTGQNAITVVAGANAEVSADDVAAVAARLTRARVLLLQCETPAEASLAAARLVRDAGGVVILDPAPVPADGIAAFAGLAGVVTPNESEAAALTGIAVTSRDSAVAAALCLRAMGFERAIVKCGGAGLVLAEGDSTAFIAPFPVVAVDTVAAGDCFNAGLAYALARGDRFADAARFAAATGALAVTRRGAAEAAPTLQDVDKLLSATL